MVRVSTTSGRSCATALHESVRDAVLLTSRFNDLWSVMRNCAHHWDPVWAARYTSFNDLWSVMRNCADALAKRSEKQAATVPA